MTIPAPTPEQIERTRTLYAVMQGVPEGRVLMAHWRHLDRRDDSHISPVEVSDDELTSDCGSLACGLGWACAYPPFKAQGLYAARSDYACTFPAFRREDGGIATNYGAAAQFFGMTDSSAGVVFGPDRTHTDEVVGPTLAIRGGLVDGQLADKARLLRRLRRFLLWTGAITAERNAELAQMEGSPE